MRRIVCVLLVIQIFGCSSGGSSGSPASPSEQLLSSPAAFSVTPHRDGSVMVTWEQSTGITYDLYTSTDPAFDPENYSVYDNSAYERNVGSPHIFNPANPAETYTFKLFARDSSAQSAPAVATAYTRFITSVDDPSIYFDALLDLEVKRCSEGQQYDFFTEQCLNDAVRFTPGELAVYLNDVEGGWRLPTTTELDGLSPCNLSGTQAACVPQSEAYIITDFFLGSAVAAYYDQTALQPYLDDGGYWHMSHGFPDDYRVGRVNYGSNPNMLAVLVRTVEF